MDEIVDDFVLVQPEPPTISRPAPVTPNMNSTPDYISSISKCIDEWSSTLRPISLKIHDNPELNYKEHVAHATLVAFFQSLKGWEVVPKAYGINTAFIAMFDSGRKGPVVSFNAEYGKQLSLDIVYY